MEKTKRNIFEIGITLKVMKRFIKLLIKIVVLFIIYSFVCYVYISLYSFPYLHDSIADIPYNQSTLLLGTSPQINENSYFMQRINATVELYNGKKINNILISGDGAKKNYNEPKAMFTYLKKANIPSENLTQDILGVRTIDSILRAKDVYNYTSFTIISQKFHNERAVFIARSLGLNAIGYNAPSQVDKITTLKMFFRELLARAEAVPEVLFYILFKINL